jgi:transketolase
VHLALDARDRLAGDGIAARVVSMPSMNRFDAQPDAYRASVLPPDVPTLAVEAGITRGWREYVGDDGAVIGLDRFGLSGPGDDVYAELGFTVDHVADRAQALL